MDRMAKMGVLVSANIQGYNGIEGTTRNLGRERAEHQAPMRELLDHHVIVGTGSDWPGDGPDNMLVNVGFYVTRKSKDGKISGAAQKITRQEALRIATVNNAYLTFEEDVKGSIEAGKLADFVVLDKDIMTVPEDEIGSILPLATYVGGRKVFSKTGAGF
jgi:predicted amidohydrolase YtcJ